MQRINDQALNLDASQPQDFFLDVGLLDGFSIQVVFTGAPSGQLTLQGRNIGGIYMPVGGAGYSLAISAAGSQMFEYTNPQFAEANLHWTGGGSGSLSIYICGRRRLD